MSNKIAIRDIETAIREAMSGSEIQFSDSVYEEKDGKLRLIIFFNKLFSTNNVVLYTKLLFEVDKNKEYITGNSKDQNFFKYLYDINCQYKMKMIDDINDFKNQWSKIIQNNEFGPNMRILSEFIKQPSFMINEWFNKNNIKDISLTGFKYEPKMKIMPCKSLSFHFVLNVNNSDDVELYIRKEDRNDYIYTFTFNGENDTIEKSDLTTLVQTIGETLKDKFGSKSQNESTTIYEYLVGEKVKIKDDSEYRYQAYAGLFGDGYGTVVRINYHYGEYLLLIKWNNNTINYYRISDVEILDNKPKSEPKIRWYDKGKLVKENAAECDWDKVIDLIGKRVKMRDDSELRNQAYINGGDGYGVVKSINNTFLVRAGEPVKKVSYLQIEWNNGYKKFYPLSDLEILDDEPKSEPKIRWYNKGKLVNEIIFDYEYLIGKRVKISEGSDYKDDAYEKGGNGYGVIIHIEKMEPHPFQVKWDESNLKYHYRMHDLEILDDEPTVEPRVRWYNKGKLLQENVSEYEHLIGKKVKIKDDSQYRDQAYNRNPTFYGNMINGDGCGTIVGIKYDSNDYILRIKWNNGVLNIYRFDDVEFLDDVPKSEPKVRWYNKGKLLQENVSKYGNLIGKRVRMKDDSEFKNQAYLRNGDGYGTVIDVNYNQYYSLRIKWNNGMQYYQYRFSDVEILDNETNPELNPETRVRWYNKGKLLQENVSKYEHLIGKRVKIKNNSKYKFHAYFKNGDGCGVIKKINNFFGDNNNGDCVLRIVWDNGWDSSYRLHDVEILDDEPNPEPNPEPKIRWYNKGKLQENVSEYEHLIGKKVKIKDDSEYKDQAYSKNGDGYGRIISVYNQFSGEDEGHILQIKWNNNHNNDYRLSDVEILDDDPKSEPTVRWYKKGKLIRESLSDGETFFNI